MSMSAFPKTMRTSPSDSAIAQPRPRISTSWRRSLEAKHSRGIKCVTLQSSDLKSQLTSVMETYSTEREILTRNTRVPEKAAEKLWTPHPWPAQLLPRSLRSQLPANVFILCPRFGETLTTRPSSHLDAFGTKTCVRNWLFHYSLHYSTNSEGVKPVNSDTECVVWATAFAKIVFSKLAAQ